MCVSMWVRVGRGRTALDLARSCNKSLPVEEAFRRAGGVALVVPHPRDKGKGKGGRFIPRNER